MNKTIYSLEVICQKVGIRKSEIIHYVEKQIISPLDQERMIFDKEDFTRISLIQDLKKNCDPNDESLQIILHLIDQIHCLHNRIKNDEN